MFVTLIQARLNWEDPSTNRAYFSEKLASLQEATDLIVLPEMFTTGFTMNAAALAEPMDGPTMQWLTDQAKAKQAVITGSFIAVESGQYFNRLVWMQPDGQYHTYDKRHLFTFAGEDQYYTAGNRHLNVEWKGWRIMPLICYDLRFPVWSRNRFNKEQKKWDYDVLIYVANWPEIRSYPWKQLLIARAIENQCFVVGVNRIGKDGNGFDHAGDSMVINPRGEIISKTKTNQESVETIELDINYLNEFRKVFPVGLDADDFDLL
jgi:predicted amidohydrolase